jgi:subtilisin family serine protease
LSYKTFDEPLYDHTYAEMDGNTAPSTIAADMAASRGMVIVNSAGNDGGSSTWPYVGAPADGDSVFSIGAVDPDGQYVYFSSIGPTADGRLKPNFMAQGANTVVASTNGGTATSSGTSFSSPISAGITACLWQANPTMNNMEILNSIQLSGSMASNPDNQMGYGIPDFGLANLILSGFNTDLVSETNDIDIYPNPFYDELKIVYNSADTQQISIEILDISGKLVYSKQNIKRNSGLNYFKITNLEDLHRGVYFLKISSDVMIVSEKIVKFK